jgi:hypothetical protein
VTALAVTPDGKILASGSVDKTVKLWSLPEGKLLATLEGHQNSVFSLAVTPDGKLLASGSYDATVKLWSLPKGKLLATLKGHRGSVYALAVTPDGKILASGSIDNTVNLWNLPEGNLLATLEGHQNDINALAVTPDGKVLASGSDDDTVKFWSLPEGNLLATLKGHRGGVAALAVTPDGKVLASGGWDKTVKLWNLAPEEGESCFLSSLCDPAANTSKVKAMSYNVYDKVTGKTITYTLPCGSPIPADATCTCNCVPGTYSPPSRGGVRTYCSCDTVCTCVPVMMPSSRRWKRDIRPLRGALDQVQSLSGVRFDWTDDAPPGHAGSDLGFIAEQVAEVVPEVVPLDDNGEAQGVDYARLTTLLVEAVKTQQRQIEELRVEVERLREEVALTLESPQGRRKQSEVHDAGRGERAWAPGGAGAMGEGEEEGREEAEGGLTWQAN